MNGQIITLKCRNLIQKTTYLNLGISEWNSGIIHGNFLHTVIPRGYFEKFLKSRLKICKNYILPVFYIATFTKTLSVIKGYKY